MTTLACPFCGSMLEDPIHFCQECGRAVTPEDLARGGLKLNNKSGNGNGNGNGDGDVTASSARRFAVSKKDHTNQRQMRSFLYTTSTVLVLVIGYYGVMKFVLHEHMPGNLDIKMEQLAKGETVDWKDWKTTLKNPAPVLPIEESSATPARPQAH